MAREKISLVRSDEPTAAKAQLPVFTGALPLGFFLCLLKPQIIAHAFELLFLSESTGMGGV